MPAEKLPKKRKAAAAAPVKRSTARAKPVAAATPKRNSKPLPVASGEQRLALIAEAAYFRAERRGFSGGSELEDWLQAEAEVDGLLTDQPTARKPKRRSASPMPGR